tara:strand:+ start:10401 stop:10778 length:378 start_codon:yes stop_codon:yes gene_type:complete
MPIKKLFSKDQELRINALANAQKEQEALEKEVEKLKQQNTNMQYNIEIYVDGKKAKYGHFFNLDIEEAADELIQYDYFSEKYTLEELEFLLEVGFTDCSPYLYLGCSLLNFKVTRWNKELYKDMI